ncbi:MAG: TonB-dependent receptor [Gammaproteobacteria bacterium]|nr:TonB-dependent receptor [Gammaproteobacteria bacterium]
MRRNKIANAVKFAVAVTSAASLFSTSVFAAEETTAEEEQSAKITVTGTRIKRTDAEGVAPVITLTREELELKGHANLYDALQGLTISTGQVQGEQYTNSFTPNAQSVNLRGFGANRVLVLLNGRRMANNPTPFNSTDNFFNFATIPTNAIERVDILTDGASAIYGSDAIAGVINIILRDDFDGASIAARIGQTRDGGGESYRINGGFGKTEENYSFTVGYEWDRREPLFGKDRDELDSVNDGPNPSRLLERTILDFDNFTATYADPGQAACDAHPELEYAFREGRGFYCGRDAVGDESLRSYRDRKSVFGHFTYELDNAVLSTDVLYWTSNARSSGFRLWWGEDFLGNDGTNNWNGDWRYYQRVFSPLETGPQEATFDEDVFTVMTALDGFVGDYDYTAAISFNQYDYKDGTPRFIEEDINRFFLGVDPADVSPGQYLFGYPIIGSGQAPQGDIYTFFTPEQLAPMMGTAGQKSDSYAYSASFQLSGDLMTMDAGPLQFAAVIEYNKQGYDIELDQRSQDGGWWGFGGTGGGGDRDQVALGAEFLVPLLNDSAAGDLELNVAFRRDDYNDDSNVGDASTWKMGLSWKPVDELLVRSTVGTSFRAPDLHLLFADPSVSFSSALDWNECLANDDDAGTPGNNTFGECNGDIGNDYFDSYQGTFQGNLDLEEEEGRTFTFGLVYEPMDNLSFTLDYYDIELRNQVTRTSGSQILRWEAECDAGFHFITGEPRDSNGEFCQGVYSQIVRSQLDSTDVTDIETPPINLALRRQQGFDLSTKYRLETDELGTFGFDLSYTHILATEVQTDQEDPTTMNREYRDDPGNPEIRTRTTFVTSWQMDSWTTALSMFRKGSFTSGDGTYRIHPWIVWNLSTQYAFNEDTSVGFTVVNLDNERPPYDASYTSWPFFYRGQYNAVGQEYFLEVRHNF